MQTGGTKSGLRGSGALVLKIAAILPTHARVPRGRAGETCTCLSLAFQLPFSCEVSSVLRGGVVPLRAWKQWAKEHAIAYGASLCPVGAISFALFSVQPAAMKILLVEDDRDMSKALARALEKRGFGVTPCYDGINAFQLMRQEAHDLVILDLSIPGEDGLHLLQRVRNNGIRTPVLVLTARSSVGDRIAGLNAGGDDYLSKPFDLDELEARLRALLRRSRGHEEQSMRCGGLRHERASGAFYNGDEPLELTPREQTMLQALIARPGHAVTKERLFRVVFADEAQTHLEAIEVVAHRLRKKLAGTGAELMTLRGLGYLLREEKAPRRTEP